MNRLSDIKDFQEQHLDTMIKLSFDMDDAEEVFELVGSSDPELTLDEQKMTDRILQESFRKIDENIKREKYAMRWVKAKKFMPKIIQAAACLVLILSIALPIAFATSAELRARVMRFIIQFNEEEGEAYILFEEDPSASFSVPEGWQGNHFPSYIPKGFSIHNYDSFFTMIEYRNDNDSQLYYCEYDEYTQGLTGTDNTETSVIELNGEEAYVIEGTAMDGITHTVTIVWSNDTNWFLINAFNIPREEAIKVAESVKRIN